MVGEAPAHNEATGRGLYAPLIGGPPLGEGAGANGHAHNDGVSYDYRDAAGPNHLDLSASPSFRTIQVCPKDWVTRSPARS